jgi:hypothetical protein
LALIAACGEQIILLAELGRSAIELEAIDADRVIDRNICRGGRVIDGKFRRADQIFETGLLDAARRCLERGAIVEQPRLCRTGQSEQGKGQRD